MAQLGPPIWPYQGTRGIDDFGAGGFGAPRKVSDNLATKHKIGDQYAHKGIDFIGKPGDAARFVMDARVFPDSGHAYADTACDLRSIHLLGVGAWDGLRAVLLYAMPRVVNGALGAKGDPLGLVQNVASYHESHNPGKHMINHVHLELYELVNGVWELRDPTRYLTV